jgi:hypothetical protein
MAVGRSVDKVVGCASDAMGGVMGTPLRSTTGAAIGEGCSTCVSERGAASVGVVVNEALHPLSTRNISMSEKILTLIYLSRRIAGVSWTVEGVLATRVPPRELWISAHQ